MAFPVVSSVNYSEETADTTTHDVLVPASISAGELLMLFVAIDGITVTEPTMTGWTTVHFENFTGITHAVWYKFASGSETNFTYTTSVAEKSANRTWRVTGAHASTAPAKSSGASAGNFTSFNAPTVTPSWGAEDNLFVPFLAASGALSVSTYPTNYSDNQFFDTTPAGDGTDAGVALCSRNLNAASENPDSFTLGVAVDGAVKTYAIRPSAAGGGATVLDPFGMSGFFGS